MELEVLMATSAGKILLTRAWLCQKRRLHRSIAHENKYLLITSPSIHSLDLVEALVYPAHFPTRKTRHPATGNPSTSHIIIEPPKVTRSYLNLSSNKPAVLTLTSCDTLGATYMQHLLITTPLVLIRLPVTHPFPHAGMSNAHNNLLKNTPGEVLKLASFMCFWRKAGFDDFGFWVARLAFPFPGSHAMDEPAIIVEKGDQSNDLLPFTPSSSSGAED